MSRGCKVGEVKWYEYTNINESVIKDFIKEFNFIDRKNLKPYLYKEYKKKISYDHKEEVLNDESLKDDLINRYQEGHLLDLANEVQMTTTHLAKALAGVEYLQYVIDKTINEDSTDSSIKQDEFEEGFELNPIKEMIAKEAVKIQSQDVWNGHELNRFYKKVDATIECENMIKVNDTGKKGNAYLTKDLLLLYGCKSEYYLTKEQQLQLRENSNESNEICTPDVLFKSTIAIKNKKINWIEVTYNFIDENISPSFMYKDFVEKMTKYSKRYGSGAVLFISGFSTSTKLFLNGLNIVSFKRYEQFE